MPPKSDICSDRGLTERLRRTRFGDLRWFDRIDSTNTYALDAARAGAPEGLVVVADEQTAGRGRLGRRWESPARASLLVSVLLRPGSPRPQRATMATALAMRQAIDAVAGVDARLKWPNDVVASGKKLAGVLAEADGDAVVVGAGCNVNWGALPDELADTATACDLEAGAPVDRAELLVCFLHALDACLDDLQAVPADYRAALETLGRRVRVERTNGDLEGEAVDLDADGALVVSSDDGRRVSVHAADVVHLRPTDS